MQQQTKQRQPSIAHEKPRWMAYDNQAHKVSKDRELSEWRGAFRPSGRRSHGFKPHKVLESFHLCLLRLKLGFTRKKFYDQMVPPYRDPKNNEGRFSAVRLLGIG